MNLTITGIFFDELFNLIDFIIRDLQNLLHWVFQVVSCVC